MHVRKAELGAGGHSATLTARSRAGLPAGPGSFLRLPGERRQVQDLRSNPPAATEKDPDQIKRRSLRNGMLKPPPRRETGREGKRSRSARADIKESAR